MSSLIRSNLAMEQSIALLSFVIRVGNHFSLDGQPFYVNGWNSYWFMVNAADASTRSRVDDVLAAGASLGLTVCRTWAFNDATWQALQVSPGNYDENVFQVTGFRPRILDLCDGLRHSLQSLSMCALR